MYGSSCIRSNAVCKGRGIYLYSKGLCQGVKLNAWPLRVSASTYSCRITCDISRSLTCDSWADHLQTEGLVLICIDQSASTWICGYSLCWYCSSCNGVKYNTSHGFDSEYSSIDLHPRWILVDVCECGTLDRRCHGTNIKVTDWSITLSLNVCKGAVLDCDLIWSWSWSDCSGISGSDLTELKDSPGRCPLDCWIIGAHLEVIQCDCLCPSCSISCGCERKLEIKVD